VVVVILAMPNLLIGSFGFERAQTFDCCCECHGKRTDHHDFATAKTVSKIASQNTTHHLHNNWLFC
jgi:hypothetical protein